MIPFTTFTAIAAAYPIANIDTDKIVPARFLKTISKIGLGKALFHDARYDAAGRPRADFVLNMPPWDKAGILVAGPNFGCGSSREHAPWALADFGIRCILAESFADIFFNNCFKNGVLPLALPAESVRVAMAAAREPRNVFTVDLPNRLIMASKTSIRFAMDDERAEALIAGRDHIDHTLQFGEAIKDFENRRREHLWIPSVLHGLRAIDEKHK
jgi:3-isopropylmalate/(R)-2-methylmalate dehydratase small subunit